MVINPFGKNKFQLVQGIKLVTKYLTKSKNIKQNWTRPERFDVWSCICFDCYYQKLVFGGDTGH